MIRFKKSAPFLVIIFFICFFAAHEKASDAEADEKRLVFSTWEGFELDKCASIWLIKRFVSDGTIIKYYPKGEDIKQGIPFDTPDAALRRYHNMSTFESIVKHYKLQDSTILYIGKIIHDIEVNIWERKVLKETLEVQKTVNAIIKTSERDKDVIEKSSEYFDNLYEDLSRERSKSK